MISAKEIRRLWCEERRLFDLRTIGVVSGWGNKHMAAWDGGVTPNGINHKCVWPLIATFCEDNNLDPETLIRAMFFNASIPPMPNQAKGSFALEKYNFYTCSTTELEIKNNIRYEFESQKARIVSDVESLKQYLKLDEETAWRSAIVSRNSSLSPLFRYCVAVNQNWDDIAKDYASSAKRQYLHNKKIYDDIWGDWVPPSLKEDTTCGRIKTP